MNALGRAQRRAVVVLLAQGRKKYTTAEISEATGVPRGTLGHVLGNLRREGLAVALPKDGKSKIWWIPPDARRRAKKTLDPTARENQ